MAKLKTNFKRTFGRPEYLDAVLCITLRERVYCNCRSACCILHFHIFVQQRKIKLQFSFTVFKNRALLLSYSTRDILILTGLISAIWTLQNEEKLRMNEMAPTFEPVNEKLFKT